MAVRRGTGFVKVELGSTVLTFYLSIPLVSQLFLQLFLLDETVQGYGGIRTGKALMLKQHCVLKALCALPVFPPIRITLDTIFQLTRYGRNGVNYCKLV